MAGHNLYTPNNQVVHHTGVKVNLASAMLQSSSHQNNTNGRLESSIVCPARVGRDFFVGCVCSSIMASYALIVSSWCHFSFFVAGANSSYTTLIPSLLVPLGMDSTALKLQLKRCVSEKTAQARQADVTGVTSACLARAVSIIHPLHFSNTHIFNCNFNAAHRKPSSTNRRETWQTSVFYPPLQPPMQTHPTSVAKGGDK
ncbi:hypothetical protein ACFE04_004040 [Oxalis oulophora]